MTPTQELLRTFFKIQKKDCLKKNKKRTVLILISLKRSIKVKLSFRIIMNAIQIVLSDYKITKNSFGGGPSY